MSMLWKIRTQTDLGATGLAAAGVLDAYVRGGERTFALALSGGRAAPLLFSELVRQARQRRVFLNDVEFFWCDERCVPADHPESNYRAAREGLLEPLGVADRRVHRLHGELPPEAGAEVANEGWRSWLESRQRWGRDGDLDCAILGVGEDGHVASLFPSAVMDELESGPAFRAVRGPKPPADRLTMNYRLLRNARFVIVIVTGPGKEAVVHESLEGGRDTPLARVLAGREGRETWIVENRVRDLLPGSAGNRMPWPCADTSTTEVRHRTGRDGGF